MSEEEQAQQEEQEEPKKESIVGALRKSRERRSKVVQSGFVVAQGKAITAMRPHGVIAEGETITADMLGGGEAALRHLVEQGYVVEK